jgi:outer membrane biogenesis lipoprotein LolB
MKISARNIVFSAWMTLAVGLFMTAFAQNAKAQSVINVSGTTWVGTDSDGDYYEYSFQADGALYYKSPSGFYKHGTWKQDGDSIYMETNDKYSEYQGRITGTHIEGNAWNVKDLKWTWVADLRNTPPAFANGAAASLAGTSCYVIETNGDRDIFNFVADGTLSYSYQNGSYTNGTWKQDGDSIYIEMNNKFVEYRGRITGSHIEGTASNVKGKNWTWIADIQSAASIRNATPIDSSVASIAGTTWSGPDTHGRHYDYEFLADGTLHYTYETGSFTDATWKQDGDSIYMSINNKYSERQGRITGSHMQGDAWNVKGEKWTWEADKK